MIRVPKKLIITLVVTIVGIAIAFLAIEKNTPKSNNKNISIPISSKDHLLETYTPPKIPKKDVYSIVMVGDSMTEAIGPHGGKFNEYINVLYGSTPGNQKIVIDNYAKGATNILGPEKAMNQKTPIED